MKKQASLTLKQAKDWMESDPKGFNEHLRRKQANRNRHDHTMRRRKALRAAGYIG